MTEDDWTERAACKTSHGGHDPVAFNQKAGNPTNAERAFKARCRNACPIRDECLERALAMEVNPVTGRPLPDQNRFGIWGGYTPLERHRLHLERHNADR